MVYSKANGRGSGFSMEKQLRFLQQEHADNLEEIVTTKLEVLAQRSPKDAEYYEELRQELDKRIIEGMRSIPDYGYDDSNRITKAFLAEHHLESLLEEEPSPESMLYWCYACEDFTPHCSMENG